MQEALEKYKLLRFMEAAWFHRPRTWKVPTNKNSEKYIYKQHISIMKRLGFFLKSQHKQNYQLLRSTKRTSLWFLVDISRIL